MRARFALLGVAALLVAPTPAVAQVTLAPPGKAGADQYFETIPSSAGNAKPPLGSTSPPSARSSAVPPGALRELSRSKDGRAAAGFANGTAPSGAHGTAAGTRNGSGPASTALKPFGGSDTGGLGAALPILLATLTVALVALAIGSRRHQRDSA